MGIPPDKYLDDRVFLGSAAGGKYLCRVKVGIEEDVAFQAMTRQANFVEVVWLSSFFYDYHVTGIT